MKLVVNKELKNNTYRVELQVLDITDTDKEKISDFGEPVIDVGGVVLGDGTQQEYVPVQEPVTRVETQTQTVVEKQTVKETQPLFEDDGVTPVFDEDGVTQLTQEVDVEKDVEVQKEVEVTVPVLDENGEPLTQDKLDENGEKIYQLVEKPVKTVLADLGKQLRKFPSDFPVVSVFAVADYGGNTELIANEYVHIVKEALTEAIEQLESKEDTFSGKEEIQL